MSGCRPPSTASAMISAITAGRFYGLFAISSVLVAMLIETTDSTATVERAERLSGEVEQAKLRMAATEAQSINRRRWKPSATPPAAWRTTSTIILAVIIGNLDLLIEQRDDPKEVAALGNEALDAATRGADLTRRLLAFARRQPLQPRGRSISTSRSRA